MACTVTPLNNFVVSSLPLITGGREGVGSGEGVDGTSAGAKRCKRSRETQR